MTLTPISFREACSFIEQVHRHHKPPRGHKFSIGLKNGEQLVGVICVGRPVARAYDDGFTAEVTRSATDGTKNANSMLYGAAWRAAKAMGYKRIITYTQEGESGASLKAAGWKAVAKRAPRKGWNSPSRPRTGNGNDNIERTLWEVRS